MSIGLIVLVLSVVAGLLLVIASPRAEDPSANASRKQLKSYWRRQV